MRPFPKSLCCLSTVCSLANILTLLAIIVCFCSLTFVLIAGLSNSLWHKEWSRGQKEVKLLAVFIAFSESQSKKIYKIVLAGFLCDVATWGTAWQAGTQQAKLWDCWPSQNLILCRLMEGKVKLVINFLLSCQVMLVFSFFKQIIAKSKFKKREVQVDKRVFHENWEFQFYVIAVKDKLKYLICNSMITDVKKYDAFQHYAIHKNHKYSLLEGEVREDKAWISALATSISDSVSARDKHRFCNVWNSVHSRQER